MNSKDSENELHAGLGSHLELNDEFETMNKFELLNSGAATNDRCAVLSVYFERN